MYNPKQGDIVFLLTEHMKCLDIASRNIRFVEKIPEDLLNKTLAYVKAFF